MQVESSNSVEDVRATRARIDAFITSTPIVASDSLSTIVSGEDLAVRLLFKCENHQKSGSFKFRGAANFVAQLSDAELERGLVAISTGNFGFAVAHAASMAAEARTLNVPTSVVLPMTSSPFKIESAKRHGAIVVLAGSRPDDREAAAQALLRESGAILVGPMDDTKIVFGQGTVTLDFLDQVRKQRSRLDAIVLPSATGGLLAGASIVCEKSGCAVYGCEPRVGGPGLHCALTTGQLTAPQKQDSMADGLRASTSHGNFERIRDRVDGFVTANEDEIQQAWRLLLRHLSPSVGLIEPSAAVALACLLHNPHLRAALRSRQQAENRPLTVGIVLTGGNVTPAQVRKTLGEEV